MTTKTRTELKNQALANLLVIGSGQEAEEEDAATVDALIDPLLEDLNARGIAYVPNTDEIEAALFLPLAELLANEAAPSFGQPKNPPKQDACEERLRLVTQVADAPNRLLQSDTALKPVPYMTYNRWLTGR